MTAIPTTFCAMRRTSVEPDFAPLAPLTDRESCSLAERVLDGEGTAYVNRDNELIAYALTEDACARLERDERDLPSLDYAFDLIGEAEEDLTFERSPETSLKLLRAELEDVAGELDRIRKGEKS
jgi:hypothetical protein